MKNEIIKVAINPFILRELEKIATGTNTPIDEVISYSYEMMVALYRLPKKERMALVNKLLSGN